MNKPLSFEHQILISMPSLDNSWFKKTVIYVVEDNIQGSMGLVLNLPHKFNFSQLLKYFKFDLSLNDSLQNKPVLIGGPLDMEHGFVLYKGGSKWKQSIDLEDNLSLSVSEDILKAIGKGEGPEDFIACLGFAGWDAGQLAREINENSWLTIPYNEALLFEVSQSNKWNVALGTLGVSPEFLSTEVGRDC